MALSSASADDSAMYQERIAESVALLERQRDLLARAEELGAEAAEAVRRSYQMWATSAESAFIAAEVLAQEGSPPFIPPGDTVAVPIR